MKYFAVIAGLMLIGNMAYAVPPDLPKGDFVRHYDHNHYASRQSFQVADRGDQDQRRDADHGRDRRTDRSRDRDRHVDNSRDGDRYRSWDSDRYRSWNREHAPAFYRPDFGHSERRLPRERVFIRVRNHPYYYFGGTFYDYYGGSYVIVNAPIGAMVPYLPGGYVSFLLGPTRYFYFGGTYYINRGQQYEVVEPPPEAHQIVNTADHEMIIYPAKGQSQDQLNNDRYNCHLWAVKQTGFDPSTNNPDLSLKPDYVRAMSACLEAKGYVVK